MKPMDRVFDSDASSNLQDQDLNVVPTCTQKLIYLLRGVLRGTLRVLSED